MTLLKSSHSEASPMYFSHSHTVNRYRPHLDLSKLGKSGYSGNSSKSGDSCESGMLAILVNLVILVTVVTVVNLVILRNLAILVILVTWIRYALRKKLRYCLGIFFQMADPPPPLLGTPYSNFFVYFTF